MHAASMAAMTKMVQVRDVPDDLHAALKDRARRSGMSLSDYLRTELARIAARPVLADVLAETAGWAAPLTFAEAVEDVHESRRHQR